jgi:hypothetical protein
LVCLHARIWKWWQVKGILSEESSTDAKLNIEGTDWLLVVMPEVERTPGKVIAYLVPTKEAVEAAKRGHQEWLATKPNTKGPNRPWNLWFDTNGASKPNNGFETKWSKYRLRGEGEAAQPVGFGQNTEPGNVKAEVETARQRISKAAGISPDAVKITIQFGL